MQRHHNDWILSRTVAIKKKNYGSPLGKNVHLVLEVDYTVKEEMFEYMTWQLPTWERTEKQVRGAFSGWARVQVLQVASLRGQYWATTISDL